MQNRTNTSSLMYKQCNRKDKKCFTFSVVMTHVTAVTAHYSVYALITVRPIMLWLQMHAFFLSGSE